MSERTVFTIYKNPLDENDDFIVRQWGVEGGALGVDFVDTGILGRAKTIEYARSLIPSTHSKVPSPEDLQILETWI